MRERESYCPPGRAHHGMPLQGLILLCMVLFANQCKTGEVFEKTHTIQADKGNVYIYRMAMPIWSFLDFRITLSAYEGDFRNAKPKAILGFDLAEGNYLFWRLNPGYYELAVEDRPELRRILHIQPGSEQFWQFYIFSPSYFSLPELTLRHRSRSEAMEDFVDSAVMYRMPISHPP